MANNLCVFNWAYMYNLRRELPSCSSYVSCAARHTLFSRFGYNEISVHLCLLICHAATGDY